MCAHESDTTMRMFRRVGRGPPDQIIRARPERSIHARPDDPRRGPTRRSRAESAAGARAVSKRSGAS